MSERHYSAAYVVAWIVLLALGLVIQSAIEAWNWLAMKVRP